VRVNGDIVRSCLMLAVQPRMRPSRHIEGLSDSGEIADLQTRFRRPQRAAVRILHAGHADGGAGSANLEPNRTATESASISRAITSLHGYQASSTPLSTAAGAQGASGMTTSANPEPLSVLDRPNSYIGKSVPRPNLERLMQGAGCMFSDMVLRAWRMWCSCARRICPRKIVKIDADAAKRVSGVIAIVTARSLRPSSPPWVACFRI